MALCHLSTFLHSLIHFLVISSLCASDIGDNNTDSQAIYWKAILGDICQLPSIPRATSDPTRYLECVRRESSADERSDLGIWFLRDCAPGQLFVAILRQCDTLESVKLRQQLCDSENASAFDFCPPQSDSNYNYIVEDYRHEPTLCVCPSGDKDCLCVKPEVLQLTRVSNNITDSVIRKRSLQTQPIIRYSNDINEIQSIYSQQALEASSNKQVLSGIPVRRYPSQTVPYGLSVERSQSTQPQSKTTQVNRSPCYITSNQQIYCPNTGTEVNSVTRAYPCPLVRGDSTAYAQYQGICSWMIDPLVRDPQYRDHFLQCQPAPDNLFCGRWQRMPCEPGLVFDASLQVCVWDATAQPGNIPPYTGQAGSVEIGTGQLLSGQTGLGQITTGQLIPGQIESRLGPFREYPKTQGNVNESNNKGNQFTQNNECYDCPKGSVRISSCDPSGACPGQSVCRQIISSTNMSQRCNLCCYSQ